jgi:hypothetical protein
MGMLVKSAALAVAAAAVVLSSGSAVAGKAAAAAAAVSGTTIRARRPAAPGSGNWLLGVSCLTRANCVAVGSTPFNESPGVLAERWHGKSWKIDPVPVPRPAQAGAGLLSGVSCPSATECVAVGTYHLAALAETWNGRAWTLARPPSPRGTSSAFGASLSAVSCATAKNCVAVGGYTLRNGDDAPLAESRSGRRWRLATPRAVRGSSYSGLTSVSCVSAAYCVAAGEYQTAAGYFVLIESWNGSSWTRMPAPDPAGGQYSVLSGVSCVSKTRCVAVGGTDAGSGQNLTGFSELWNGTAWTMAPVAWPRRTGNSFLLSVSCVSARSCMAVGDTGFPRQDFFTVGGQAAAVRWDGRTWKATITPAARRGTYRIFWSVRCLSAAACIAVGPQEPDGNPLSGFWNGTRWKLIPAQ